MENQKKLELFYPVEPHRVNLPYGVRNEKYRRFGFEAHNGVDLGLVTGQPIFAPFDCDVINIGNVPNGSGVFISVLSKESYVFDDTKTAYVLLDFMHCERIIPPNGASMSLGQILAFGDSTGFSTGDHTHMQARRVSLEEVSDTSSVHDYRIREDNFVIRDVDLNNANNSFDPEPFWNRKYASHYNPLVIEALQKQVAELKEKLEMLQNKAEDGHRKTIDL